MILKYRIIIMHLVILKKGPSGPFFKISYNLTFLLKPDF